MVFLICGLSFRFKFLFLFYKKKRTTLPFFREMWFSVWLAVGFLVAADVEIPGASAEHLVDLREHGLRVAGDQSNLGHEVRDSSRALLGGGLQLVDPGLDAGGRERELPVVVEDRQHGRGGLLVDPCEVLVAGRGIHDHADPVFGEEIGDQIDWQWEHNRRVLLSRDCVQGL